MAAVQDRKRGLGCDEYLLERMGVGGKQHG